jgi:hypothetical protein
MHPREKRCRCAVRHASFDCSRGEDVRTKLGVESRCAAPIAAMDVSPDPFFAVNDVQYCD